MLCQYLLCKHMHRDTHSSDRGVIFFSSTSSSANFFWYFSQFWPVALGMMGYAAAKEIARVDGWMGSWLKSGGYGQGGGGRGMRSITGDENG
jgi:hypothetical protein